jgi:hypothetical protein
MSMSINYLRKTAMAETPSSIHACTALSKRHPVADCAGGAFEDDLALVAVRVTKPLLAVTVTAWRAPDSPGGLGGL